MKRERKRAKRERERERESSISDCIVALLSLAAKRVVTFYIVWLHSRYAVMHRCFADMCIHMLLRCSLSLSLSFSEECPASRCFRNGRLFTNDRVTSLVSSVTRSLHPDSRYKMSVLTHARVFRSTPRSFHSTRDELVLVTFERIESCRNGTICKNYQ